VKSNGGYREVDIEVIPVRNNSTREGGYLVVFEERAAQTAGAVQPEQAEKSPATPPAAPQSKPMTGPSESEREANRLQQELAATREYLQSVIEQQEATNEDLQLANEEVQSANEELQSINEELETSKEEIQSSNEELATVNEELHNRNLELSQSNNDLTNLLASVQMAIVMLGPDLRIRRFTPMAEKMMNLIPADIGRPIKDLNLRVGIPDLEQLLQEVIGTDAIKELEARDEKGRWYLIRLRPYRTLESRIDGAVLVLIDVDSIKRNEETLRRQTELLDQAYEPIIMWQLDGVITYWNSGAEQTYGFPRQEALGRVVHELLGSSIPIPQLTSELHKHGSWTGELIQVCKNNVQIEVESRMVLARDADGNRLVIEASRPITERKRMEQELRRRADELLAADRAKDEFLAMLAHELRNPLAALRNAGEIFRRTQLPDASLASIRDVIGHQVGNMARMVDDLLDVARLTGRGIELRKSVVDLLSVIKGAIEMTRPEFAGRNQTLSVSLPEERIRVEGDAVRLEQIVGNLLVNASKFTPNGGHAWLSVQCDATGATDGKAAKRAAIKIRDDGVGIAPEMLPHVFEQFVQAEQSLDRARGGLGIGLTLAKRLAELHGGSLEAFSRGVGKGSEFIVHLPAVSREIVSEQSASGPPVEPSLQGAHRKVLVVDDNVDSAISLRMLLEMDGHQVDVAHDGPTALKKVEEFKPDVALLDIGLPGMDGYQVARELRHNALGKGLWLVAVTGYGQDEHRQTAESAGFDRYLVKPVDVEIFRELLQSLPRRQAP